MKKFNIDYWEIDPKTFKKSKVTNMIILASDRANAIWKFGKHESLIKSIQEL